MIPTGRRLIKDVRGGGGITGATALSLVVLLIALPILSTTARTIDMAGRDGVSVGGPGDARPWWETWSRDMDRDRVDDELENVLAIGATQDGLVRVFIDMDHRPGPSDAQAMEAKGARITYKSHYLDTFVADVPATDDAVQGLLSVKGVVMVEAVHRIEKTLDTSVPSIGVDKVWQNYSYKGGEVVVGVVDTGIDANHTGLNDMDDINGTDDPKVIAFFDALNKPGTIDGTTAPYDDEGHGSHVSGIVSGTGDGSFDNISKENKYVGVAPETYLVGIKVIGPDGGGADTAMLGIEWAMDNKADYSIRILSMSFGARFTLSGVTNDGNSAISRLCDSAVDAGLVLVVAAGNSGPRPYTIAPPGDARKVITVGNVYDSHGIVPSSSRGPIGIPPNTYTKPDVCAPGSEVWSVDALTGTEYVSQTGTSMSTPHVSGLIALMLQANPSMSPGEVKGTITATADGDKARPLDATPNNDYGYGVVNAMRALESVTGGVTPPSISISPMQYASGLTTLSGTAASNSNESKVQSVEIRIGDGGAWRTATWDPDYKFWSYQWNTVETANGDIRIFARCSDGSRYSATDSKKVTVNNLKVGIDTADAPPEHSQGEYHVYGHVDGIYVKSVYLEFTDTQLKVEAESTAGVARDDYPFKTWHAVILLEDIGPGDHVYKAVADNGKDKYKGSETMLDVPGDGGGGGDGGDAGDGGAGLLAALTSPTAIAVLIIVIVVAVLLARTMMSKGKKEDDEADGREEVEKKDDKVGKEGTEEDEDEEDEEDDDRGGGEGEEAEDMVEVEAVEVVDEDE